MSDPGNFLSRWSRRKREAAAAADETAPSAESAPAAPAVENLRAAEAAAGDRSAAPGGAPATPASLPTMSLPAIESIAADTDIRAFLAPGVPPELTRAALRRAWVADPKIRDFVGLADYDWDFNTPGSMAGFGPLEMTEELRQVVARIIGPAPGEEGMESSDPASADAPCGQNASETNPEAKARRAPHGDEDVSIAQGAPVRKSDEPGAGDVELTPRDQADVAVQYQSENIDIQQSIVRRSHGRALPK
jgi:Protein of unknown function (DUF3306)